MPYRSRYRSRRPRRRSMSRSRRPRSFQARLVDLTYDSWGYAWPDDPIIDVGTSSNNGRFSETQTFSITKDLTVDLLGQTFGFAYMADRAYNATPLDQVNQIKVLVPPYRVYGITGELMIRWTDVSTAPSNVDVPACEILVVTYDRNHDLEASDLLPLSASQYAGVVRVRQRQRFMPAGFLTEAASDTASFFQHVLVRRGRPFTLGPEHRLAVALCYTDTTANQSSKITVRPYIRARATKLFDRTL